MQFNCYDLTIFKQAEKPASKKLSKKEKALKMAEKLLKVGNSSRLNRFLIKKFLNYLYLIYVRNCIIFYVNVHMLTIVVLKEEENSKESTEEPEKSDEETDSKPAKKSDKKSSKKKEATPEPESDKESEKESGDESEGSKEEKKEEVNFLYNKYSWVIKKRINKKLPNEI